MLWLCTHTHLYSFVEKKTFSKVAEKTIQLSNTQIYRLSNDNNRIFIHLVTEIRKHLIHENGKLFTCNFAPNIFRLEKLILAHFLFSRPTNVYTDFTHIHTTNGSAAIWIYIVMRLRCLTTEMLLMNFVVKLSRTTFFLIVRAFVRAVRAYSQRSFLWS